MQITFLEATNGLRLSKQYSANGAQPYPYVKAVTSHKHDVPKTQDGLQAFMDLIVKNGKSGFCLLKGKLKRDLIDESRAGLTDRIATSDLLVLDIDGVRLPKPLSTGKLTKSDVMYLANQVITELPREMHNVSYIAQASSSLGLKGDAVSLHIFMFLTVPMPPKSIKLWLQDANYESDVFSDQLQLSVNGQSLKFPLDTSVADNSKIIFIAPPTFDDPTMNPFASDDDRIVLVEREQITFDLAALMANISPQKCFEKAQSKKESLREGLGYKKKQVKLRVTNVDNSPEEILVNPDHMSISICDTSSFPYIRCNINGGDSAAYYFNIEKPTYMYNFKDEPIFEIEKADKDFYVSIFDTFEQELEKSGRSEFPVALRDYESDTFYNGVYDPNNNQFSDKFPLTPVKRENIEGFFLSHGKIAPDFIPDGKIVFDPTSSEPAVNFDQMPYYVNTYHRTNAVLNAKKPAHNLEMGHAKTLARSCPMIYRIIYHMLGNGDQEFERFINWLAYVYQTRRKTGVSWVLTGTQGTGKGIFYSRILRGLFGTKHCPMRTLQNIEEQYNSFMRDSLFLIVDEFHMASANRGTIKIADKLKSQITDNTLTIRGMRSNQVEHNNYTNFIFLTNRVDAVNIEPGDRRYNIAPKQDVKLLDAYPDMAKRLDTQEIEEELLTFAGILETFNYNKRLMETAIDNTAKEKMRSISMSVFDEFCDAIKHGRLTHFTDILDINVASVLHSNGIEAAQRLVKGWIAQSEHPYVVVPLEHFRTVFHVQTEQTPQLSQQEFKKRMSRNDVTPERKRAYKADRETNAINGVVVKWNITPTDRDHVIASHMSDNDADKRLLVAAEH